MTNPLIYTEGYDESRLELPVSGGVDIAAGKPVATDDAGLAVLAASGSGETFMGVALEQADNTSGASSDVSVTLARFPAVVYLETTGDVFAGNELYFDDEGLASTVESPVFAGIAQKVCEDRETFWSVTVNK